MSSSSPVEDPFHHSDKQQSWNDFGAAYWDLAGDSSHPSAVEVEGFLRGSGPGSSVLVAGATTSELIAEAVSRGGEVHVIDFAAKLLERATQRFGVSIRTHLHDVTRVAPSTLAGRFDAVVADRLINRFHRSEMPTVTANLMSFVRPGGRLAVSFRFGLYPLDRKLIRRGTELGTVDNFWDQATQTISWPGVGPEIDDVAEAHGDIPASVVADWSRMRGVESRLARPDVAQIAREASSATGVRFAFEETIDMDVAPDSTIFVATRPRDAG